ncbi:MAG: hypothetical protein A2X86_11730 [Bdellovibrionales bacterium GWA2_49_15]|nr:MAG: hypothetical protein A2X86_11730 [Bdellovibrionales bacterium GWA2_49_15]HAZ12579.1 hypothetical protein [Bdellovibrionales bacterium]
MILTKLLILLFFLTSCLRTAPTPIRIAINTWPGYEYLYLAQEKGFFKEAGLDVHLKEFTTVGDAKRAYERGQADILPGTLSELLLLGTTQGRDIVTFFVIDYSNGGDVIVARKDISSIKQLKGKKIGVEIASPGPYLLFRALEKNSMAFKDVAPIHVSLAQMTTVLQEGKIEAMVSYPPFITELLKKTDFKIIFSSREIPGEIVDVLMAEREFLKSRRKEIIALLQAYKKAQEYAKANSAESYRIMAQRENILPEDLKKSMEQDIKMVSYEGQAPFLMEHGILSKILPGIEKIMRETGQLTNAISIEKMVYSDFFDR